MIEAEWLTCTAPAAMLEFLRDRVGEWKLRDGVRHFGFT